VFIWGQAPCLVALTKRAGLEIPAIFIAGAGIAIVIVFAHIANKKIKQAREKPQ
jgi:hypothetical protein